MFVSLMKQRQNLRPTEYKIKLRPFCFQIIQNLTISLTNLII